ncbi:MAG TPA: PAS domain S-box protein [Terriglobales bacterium]|nr:PAS domain S-box protein [Terriglobales bacterium]
MTTRRGTGQHAQAAKSALTPSGNANQSLYSEIFNHLPVGVVVLHLEHPGDPSSFRIIDVNPAVASLTGSRLEDVRGRTLAEFPKLLKTPFPHGCKDVFERGKPKDLGEIACGDDRIRQGIYSVQVFPLYDNLLGVAFENVTVRHQSEQALRESEERFRLLVQSVQEYAIFQLDPLGQVVSWNGGAERLKGYRAEEVIGKQISIFYPSEDVKSGKPARFLAEAAQHGQSEDEGWRIRKDGSRFWAYVVVTALRNAKGSLQGFAKVTRDMTDWHGKEEALEKAKELLDLRFKQRTAALAQVNHELRTEIAERTHAEEQLRSLAARLQSVREEERTSIAREIHDELGQSCTALKMDLALVGRKLTTRQSHLRVKIDSAVRLVDEMIGTLRRIASELRPRTLDDLGLAAALEWQAQEFESRTGIPCHLTLLQEPLSLDSERSTAIFRIFQESLTNIVRHAQASRVEARLEREEDRLIFQVRDDGIGFNSEDAKSHRSLGLVGMQERALLLNGELKIEGVPGAGTTLTLRIPLPHLSPAPSDSK